MPWVRCAFGNVSYLCFHFDSDFLVLWYLFVHNTRFYLFILVHFLLCDSGSINIYQHIYCFLHNTHLYFYILLHFLLYDRGSINIYFYINIVLWYSHISVLRYLFFKHYTFLFLLFWCISCCTTLGPSISCSCVECLPLRVSDQIRTDDHMMINIGA